MSGQSTPGGNRGAASSPTATLLAPMIGMLGAMADLAGGSRQHFDQPGAGASPSPDTQVNPGGADLLLPMGQAMMIAANRSVSYWLGLAQIVGSHQAKLAQAAGVDGPGATAPGSQRLVAADELRAVLREVGDLAAREARLLQSELSGLDESLAQGLQQSDQPGSYHRRWRAKT